MVIIYIYIYPIKYFDQITTCTSKVIKSFRWLKKHLQKPFQICLTAYSAHCCDISCRSYQCSCWPRMCLRFKSALKATNYNTYHLTKNFVFLPLQRFYCEFFTTTVCASQVLSAFERLPLFESRQNTGSRC